jgi:hypothetical protein
MQVTITKVNKNGEIYSEIEASFDNPHDYHAFLEKVGVYIDFKDAVDEFTAGNTTYRLPLEV